MPRTTRITHSKKIRTKSASFFASALALLFAGLWIGTLAATNSSVNTWLHEAFPQFITASPTVDSDLPGVFENDGKTYVAFNHPLVNLTVVTDASCTEQLCNHELILKSIYRELTPGIALTTVDVSTEEGKSLLAQYQIGGVPAFLFDANITTIPVYTQVTDYLTPLNDNLYLLMTPFGKYYSTPEAGLAQTTGASSDDATNTIIAYESFSCSVCKTMSSVFTELLTARDDVRFVFKHYDRGASDSLLAQAAECAGDQGNFWEMEKALFAAEIPPIDVAGVTALGQNLSLNEDSFTACLDGEKYKERVAADTFEGKRFGVMGTPTFFINGVPVAGEFSLEQIEQLLTPAQ